MNRCPHGTVHCRPGFLDSEHEAEAKSNEGMRGDDTAVEESSIHLLNMPVATLSSRHERELRTADLVRYNENNNDKSLTNLAICLRIGMSSKVNIDDSLIPVFDR